MGAKQTQTRKLYRYSGSKTDIYIIIIYKLCDSPTSSKEKQRMIEKNKESHCYTMAFFVFYSCVIVLLFSLFYGLVA